MCYCGSGYYGGKQIYIVPIKPEADSVLNETINEDNDYFCEGQCTSQSADLRLEQVTYTSTKAEHR